MMEKGLRRAAAEQSLRRARAALSRLTSPFGGGAPARLHIAPQDLRTSDPTIAAEIYAGQLKFAGKLMETHGSSPFELEAPSEGFAAELHGFGWLRHLRAAETPLARANGRALVLDWIEAHGGRPRGIPARPEIAARRL
ncbi:MAG: heparinase, partial [Beijerinckiaceae bacterium]